MEVNVTLSNGETYNIDSIQKVNSAVHRGHIKTDIYIAQINSANSDDSSNNKNFIGFEIDTSYPITTDHYKIIAENYITNKSESCCTYIGVLSQNEENNIEKIFKSKVSKNFLEKYTEHLIEESKKAPKFICIDTANEYYTSVNINTGETLNLRDVQKICKDSYKTYLYTASLIDESNQAYPVAFETDFRLQDIAKDQKPEEITGISQLLSIQLDTLSLKKLNYIGRFIFDGNIERNIKYSSRLLTHTLKSITKKY